MRRDLMYLYAQITLDQDNKTVTQGMHIQNFMEWLQKEDPVIELPREFVMVARVSLLLRGLGHAIGQERNIADCWKERAATVLIENGEKEFLDKYQA